MTELKVLLWNLQDLFIFLDKYKDEDLSQIQEPQWQLLSTSLTANKPVQKVREIADLIQSKDIDICLFVEVGGKESLVNLNRHFLNDEYLVFHEPSNSDRGIDMGILVKKGKLQLDYGKIHNAKVFSRGLLEARIKVSPGKSLSFLLTHLKSKLNKDGMDFEGRSKRALEVAEITKIYKRLKSKENIHSIYLAGDLNGILAGENSEAELQVFHNECKIYDVLELLNIEQNCRYTYPYYSKNNELTLMQLDYILTDKKNTKYLCSDSGVLDMDGSELKNFPISLNERRKMPSDHYPVFLKLNI